MPSGDNGPTVGEVDRRLTRLETTIQGQLTSIETKLDGTVIGRSEYDADRRWIFLFLGALIFPTMAGIVLSVISAVIAYYLSR